VTGFIINFTTPKFALPPQNLILLSRGWILADFYHGVQEISLYQSKQKTLLQFVLAFPQLLLRFIGLILLISYIIITQLTPSSSIKEQQTTTLFSTATAETSGPMDHVHG
jgi:hypothetical protein